MKKSFSSFIYFAVIATIIIACIDFLTFAKFSFAYKLKSFGLISLDVREILNKWTILCVLITLGLYLIFRLVHYIHQYLKNQNKIPVHFKVQELYPLLVLFIPLVIIGFFLFKGLLALIYFSPIPTIRQFYNELALNYSIVVPFIKVMTALVVLVFILFIFSKLLKIKSILCAKIPIFLHNIFRKQKLVKYMFTPLLMMFIVCFIFVNLYALYYTYFVDQKGTSPNVILITIDTLRHDHLGCYGYEKDISPNIDSFSNDATLFENVIAPIPITYPSHTTILTGLEPKNHGVVNNEPIKIANDITLLPFELRKKGYTCAAFVSGWTLHSNLADLKKYFDVYDDSFDGTERIAQETTRKALSWVKHNKTKKFFLWIHYFDPHGDYTPPIEFMEPSAFITQWSDYIRFYQLSFDERNEIVHDSTAQEQLVKQYDGEIFYTDFHFGKVVNYLKENNIYNNSLIILTADHGESLTEHDYYFDHSEGLYDVSLKVPLLIKWIEKTEKQSVNEKVGLVDLTPTVLQAVDAQYDSTQFDGNSLMRLCKDENVIWNYVYFSKIYKGELRGNRSLASIHDQNRKYILNHEWWKGFYYKPELDELYDLEADPGEFNNLSKSDVTTKNRLKEKLMNWEKSEAFEKGQNEPQTISFPMLEKLRSLGYVK